jgi:hypothetical protein
MIGIKEKQIRLRDTNPEGFKELATNLKSKLGLIVDEDAIKNEVYYRQLYKERYCEWLDHQFRLSNEQRRFAKSLPRHKVDAYVASCVKRREDYFNKFTK